MFIGTFPGVAKGHYWNRKKAEKETQQRERRHQAKGDAVVAYWSRRYVPEQSTCDRIIS